VTVYRFAAWRFWAWTALLVLLPHDGSAAESATKPAHPNILLVISDQESFHLNSPADYRLPAREELQRRGVTFLQHYTAASMCTPSRAALLTGQPPQVNGVFDQMELGYVPNMPTRRPSLGTIMKQLGYATAYFGKFEMDRRLITPNDHTNYLHALRPYGFDTFAPDGDKTGHPDQGYHTDEYTVGEAARWLRTNAVDLNRQGKPWLLVVSMVNPHDIMYTDANLPGEQVQVSPAGGKLTRPPDNSLYRRQWEFPLYSSLEQPFDLPGRPRAQWEYLQGWSQWVGFIPADRRGMWKVFYNCYLNLIRDNDASLELVLDTMTELGLWQNTAVLLTADHGELAGSHGGLRGKGPFPYEQQSHIPLVIVHPDRPGGKKCRAITSNIDLVPTIVGLTGAPASQREQLTTDMPGHDLSFLLDDPESAPVDAARKAALFNYVGIQLIDANYFRQIAPLQARGQYAPPLTQLRPNLSRRGLISFVFDGRYKFARYYAPNRFNTPRTLDELFANNEVELFDLQSDPAEVDNLAVDRDKNQDLILRMNGLLNEMIADEVGVNDGQFLPPPVRPRMRGR
jgi:arylsulfatase A-like enzyme